MTNLSSTSLLNVKDFGAQGDGKHDDTSAIQAAIDVLAYKNGNAGPGILVFPSGVYCISATLNSSSQGEAGTARMPPATAIHWHLKKRP